MARAYSEGMRVKVKLFAVLRERAGVGEMEIDVAEGATVDGAAEALGERVPGIAVYLSRVAYAVNQSYAARDAVLRDGDELAVIPPVSGGWR